MVDEVNNSSDRLPNITLGLVMLDNCDRDLGGLAQSLRFAPVVDDKCTATNGSGRNNLSKCLGLESGGFCYRSSAARVVYIITLYFRTSV